METEWVEVCKHVSYKLHGGHITIRGDNSGNVENSEFTGKVYFTLPKQLTQALLQVKEHKPDMFEKAMKHFGHQALGLYQLNNMCMALSLVNDSYSGLITAAMSAHIMNGANLLTALTQGVEMTEGLKAQMDQDSKRFRKLLGEDE